jgi:hypothetical protein
VLCTTLPVCYKGIHRVVRLSCAFNQMKETVFYCRHHTRSGHIYAAPSSFICHFVASPYRGSARTQNPSSCPRGGKRTGLTFSTGFGSFLGWVTTCTRLHNCTHDPLSASLCIRNSLGKLTWRQLSYTGVFFEPTVTPSRKKYAGFCGYFGVYAFNACQGMLI